VHRAMHSDSKLPFTDLSRPTCPMTVLDMLQSQLESSVGHDMTIGDLHRRTQRRTTSWSRNVSAVEKLQVNFEQPNGSTSLSTGIRNTAHDDNLYSNHI